MSDKMLPQDAELFRRVEEIVHYVWDPIGVRGIPEARDEYYSYMTAIYGRVKSGNIEDIVEYLRWAESENMGLSFEKERAFDVANLMLRWKSYIDENS
ncbi:MAG: hypothetical protein OEZ43_00030 [Gammaproteobacteria bacterium]|nr:hypothetical protein [Gammaproteobacteria bacterium]